MFLRLLKWATALIVVAMPLIFWPDLYLTFELPKTVFFRSMVLVLLLLFILRAFFEEYMSLPRIPKVLGWVMLFLLLTFILSTVFSVAPWESFWGSYFRQTGLFTHLTFWLFAAVFVISFEKRHVSFFFRCLGLCGIFVAFFGLLQHFLPSLSGFWDVDFFLGRIFSTMGHPNALGTFLAMIFPVFLWKSPLGNDDDKKKNLRRIFWIFSTLILLMAIFLTRGRGAMLAAGFSGFVFLLIFFWRRGMRKVFCMTLLLPIFLGIFLFVGAKISPHAPLFNRLSLQGENGRSVETRLLMWPATVRMIADRPILGYGLETFSLVFPKYAPKELLLLENFQYVADRSHNEFLDIAATTGTFGLAAWILFLSVILFYALRNCDLRSVAAGCGILALLVANQFSFSTTVHWALFWFFVGCIVLLNFEKKSYTLPFFRRKLLSFCVLVVSFLAILFVIWTTSVRALVADRYFRLAQNSAENGDFLSSLDSFQLAVNTFSFQHFYNLSGARMLMSFADRLPRELRNIFLDPSREFLKNMGKNETSRDPHFFLASGILARLEGDFEVSLRIFVRAHELAPHAPALLLEWGMALADAGKYREAIAKYEEYVSLAPPYWSWKDRLDLSEDEKNQRRIFYKLNPGFDRVFELIHVAKQQMSS